MSERVPRPITRNTNATCSSENLILLKYQQVRNRISKLPSRNIKVQNSDGGYVCKSLIQKRKGMGERKERILSYSVVEGMKDSLVHPPIFVFEDLTWGEILPYLLLNPRTMKK